MSDKPENPEVLPPENSRALTAPRESGPLAARDPESILRFAIERNANVETIERVMAVRRELKQEQAKEAFDTALAAFQSECPIIVKRKAGAKNAYRYAPLDDIVVQVRDLIRKHGFSFSITSEIEPGFVKAVCKIKHSAGHSENSEFKVPVDTKNPMMSEPQRYGGSMTFAKRYAFCNGFGILTADEDMDAGARPKPPGPSTLQPTEGELKALARELWETLKSVRGTEKNWKAANDWLWREEILDGAVPEEAPNLSPERFRQVIDAAKKRLAQ